VNRWLQFPPKRRFTQDLHGSTTQKTAFFIVTAVKTSNLTEFENLFPKLNSAKTELRSNAESEVSVHKLQQTVLNRWKQVLYIYK
jgi:hypothetical protein